MTPTVLQAISINNEASIEMTLFHSAEGLDKIRHISLPYSVLSAYTYDILISLPPTNIMPGSKPQIFFAEEKTSFSFKKKDEWFNGSCLKKT